MIGLLILAATAGADPAAGVAAQVSPAECAEIDEDLRRHLARKRELLEKKKTYFRLSQWACEEDGVFEAGWYS